MSASNVCESPKFWRRRHQDRGTRWWRQILDRKYKYGRCIITLIYGQEATILASYTKSWSRKTMLTLDFRPGIEIWLFCACAIKICVITLTIIINCLVTADAAVGQTLRFTECGCCTESSPIFEILSSLKRRRNFQKTVYHKLLHYIIICCYNSLWNASVRKWHNLCVNYNRILALSQETTASLHVRIIGQIQYRQPNG